MPHISWGIGDKQMIPFYVFGKIPVGDIHTLCDRGIRVPAHDRA